MQLSELQTLLQTDYGIPNPELEPLANSWDGNVYRLSRPEPPDWVVRVLDPEEADRDGRVLAFLESHRYPAPRFIPRTGASTKHPNATSVLVTTFIEGTPGGFPPATLRRLGELLGRLHRLDSAASPDLPPAEMLPSTDMTLALRWLTPLEPHVPPELTDTYSTLLDAIHGIASSRHLPQTLIHNDAHPGNAIVTPQGTPIFIDWHGAGLGPPIVDLGFLLISCAIAPSWAEAIPSAEGRPEAIVDGYARHRIPTPAELDWLSDAMRFRALLYGAGHLATTVKQGGEQITETWWWERYLAAEALAERVRLRFERHARDMDRTS
jgi:Ser/Thr protein kinase RdoA (MazF antagonist)